MFFFFAKKKNVWQQGVIFSLKIISVPKNEIGRVDIDRIVKGYRTEADLPWESEQAEYNLKHGGYETELILCEDEYKHISSTLVRERIKNGESLDGIVPKSVESYIRSLIK